ncbi:mitochondrial large subunit ribosomal protein-domain-containing protein [Pseudomassariella vexata]|uniref:Large ribosomal subunit protein mL49 n=1 Tax=Pseudomassariella vexata TaxID=1141098 RepID=A0A1Y2E766_9PEZI|nr:mitochondrial large subunit ribosomal protein-domain-containing protein [Pseudomassariella vexata]ORY67116.1 mitochondrial large subunit ribosomal protein-domain-containing protein [Pseudomassariella vexata]
MFSRALRPLRVAVAPRISTAARQITPASARRLLTTETTIAASQPSEPPVALPQESPIIPPETAQTIETLTQRQLPYFVARNNFNNLSVYQRSGRGGSLKTTLLKKGEGNLQALRHDVAEALDLTLRDVAVNNVTKHIVVKGHKRDAIIQFLHTMGF